MKEQAKKWLLESFEGVTGVALEVVGSLGIILIGLSISLQFI